MIPIRPTLWGGHLQTCAHTKRPFTIDQYTTLNEKQEILANATLQPNQLPGLGYWAIGDGGHRVTTANNRARITPVDHLADHAALYNQMPFVLRPTNDDLSADLRANFAHRKEVNIEGRNYIGYWLRRLNMTGVNPTKIRNIRNADGTWGQRAYVASIANLNPVWPEIPADQAITTSGEYLSSSAVVPIVFSAWDVAEYLNVATVMYGDESEAVISEIAFCTGVDRQIQIQTPTGSANFMEAIAVQIDTFVGAYYQLIFENQGFDFSMEVGVSDPLLGAEEYRSASVLSVSGLAQAAG